ncbi:MAG: hypothetical protein ACI8W3_002879 [Myxococcota bacterium]|jgi:hypothetical protein
MNPFEFVMILVSIIVALGVAELLVGVARILRGELKPYWIQAIWVFTLLVMQLQYSWTLFDREAQSEWVFVDLVRLLAPPIALFLASSLLFPSRGEHVDLEEYYFAKRKPIFGLLSCVMLYYGALSISLSVLSAVQFAAVATTVVLFTTTRPLVHAALTLVYAIATLFFVASFSYTLGDSAFR